MKTEFIILIILSVLILIFLVTILCILLIRKKTKYNKSNVKLILDDELKKYYETQIEDIKKQNQNFAKHNLISILESINVKKDIFKSFTTIECNDPEKRKRLLGKQSTHKRFFENLAKVDLDIVENSNLIRISTFNSIRREVAKRTIYNLINSKNYIDEEKIKKYYNAVVEEFNTELFNIGKNVVENILKTKLNPRVYYYIGRLKFRFSYEQNMLEHSIECAYIAYNIAKQLELDPELAMLCAFFHDIGKSLDMEIKQNHVELGLQIANECELNETIKHSIQMHHSKVNTTDYYAIITKIADKISASREGARQNAKQEILERSKDLENIVKTFKEFKKCYVLKSSHELQIILDTNKSFSEYEIEQICLELKQKILQNSNFENYYLEIIISNNFVYKTKL